jgi:hypothetical protein
MTYHKDNSDVQTDVIVYGDTSGGVTAAVQAARMGKSVILVSPYGHLGGMTSSGLGWTDTGKKEILGGLSREFYHAVYQHYQSEAAWIHEPRANFQNKGQQLTALDPETELGSVFEPGVAEKIFDDMIEQAGVQVLRGRIDLKHGAEMSGDRITALRLEDGTLLKGAMFIDASYEGDLLEAAGVSFVMGRESNAEFGEERNGNTGASRHHQFPDGVDPYVVPGDPDSGLLPGVNPDPGGEPGDGDHRIQAYCFRATLTDVPENRLPVEKPDSYDELEYEILFRAIEAGYEKVFYKFSLTPNRKTDSNNDGPVSFDFIGRNYGDDWNWMTLSHAERDALAEKHRDWQLGLIWTLANHPRVPEHIRERHAPWGLPKDEYTDNGHWPYQLYVREGRRMRSDHIMTEFHCLSETKVEDPIGMAAYQMDSHHNQRTVINGMLKNEGDIQYRMKHPYGISYRSIVPKKGECTNLLVPWAMSASHIAFGSIRMEPVFMILGQSAATAACLAMDQGCPVQDLSYEELRAKLIEDDQRLSI